MIRKRLATVKKRKVEPNEYGTEIVRFDYLGKMSGYLDFISIDKGEVAQKIVEDSTHIFICDTKLDVKQGDRVMIDGDIYEVNFVDRPMLGKRAEIELKLTLEQNSMLDSYIYFGFSNYDNLIEMDILKSNNDIMKEKSFSKEVTGEGKNVFIAYPKTFGKASIMLNHKPVVDWNISEVMVMGVIHYVYITKAIDTTIHIELF